MHCAATDTESAKSNPYRFEIKFDVLNNFSGMTFENTTGFSITICSDNFFVAKICTDISLWIAVSLSVAC